MLRKFIITFAAFAFVLISPRSEASEIEIDTSSSFLLPGYSKKISMDFQNASLVDVLKIFSQQTKINLISSEELASKQITVYFDNVPVEQALEQVLRANNLTYELQPDSNIYIVKPITKTDSELITRVYILKYAHVSNARLQNALEVTYSIGDSDVTIGGDEAKGDEETGILGAIQKLLTEKGKVTEDDRTNSLTVTDVASNFSNIESAIAKLDIAVPQVLIEVEMLEVSKNTGEKIGVKYGATPLTFSGGERDHVYPWDQNALLAKGYEFAEPEYRVGTISAAGMTAIIQFLQTQTDTKNLARPRILTLSNRPAQIKISTQEAIGITDSTSSSQNLATSTVQAERVETGVFLTVLPQVNMTNRDITMAVMPKVITTTPSTISTGNASTLKDPEERGSLSILRVADGDTVVLGGLLKQDLQTVVTKLPFLGDIPFIGAAFRHRDESVADRELIIFLTPHILDEGTETKNANLKPRPILREQRELIQNRFETVERELNKKAKEEKL